MVTVKKANEGLKAGIVESMTTLFPERCCITEGLPKKERKRWVLVSCLVFLSLFPNKQIICILILIYFMRQIFGLNSQKATGDQSLVSFGEIDGELFR